MLLLLLLLLPHMIRPHSFELLHFRLYVLLLRRWRLLLLLLWRPAEFACSKSNRCCTTPQP